MRIQYGPADRRAILSPFGPAFRRTRATGALTTIRFTDLSTGDLTPVDLQLDNVQVHLVDATAPQVSSFTATDPSITNASAVHFAASGMPGGSTPRTRSLRPARAGVSAETMLMTPTAPARIPRIVGGRSACLHAVQRAQAERGARPCRKPNPTRGAAAARGLAHAPRLGPRLRGAAACRRGKAGRARYVRSTARLRSVRRGHRLPPAPWTARYAIAARNFG